MNKKYISILLVVIIVVVAAVYYKYNHILSGTADAENAVYKNEKFGFEINPKSLLKIKEENSKEGDVVSFTTSDACDKNTPRCLGGFILIKDINPQHSTLESIRSSTEYTTWGPDLVIGGEKAIQGQSNEASGQPFAIILHNNKEYYLTWDLVEDPEILSSFKFTN